MRKNVAAQLTLVDGEKRDKIAYRRLQLIHGSDILVHIRIYT